MEGNNTPAQPAGTTASAAPVSPAPRVLTTSLSHAFQAGEANGTEEQSAGFDDIFAPPETVSGPDDSPQSDESPAAAEETPSEPQEESPPAGGITEQLAKEFGLDPANPQHAKLLAKMAAEAAPAQEQQGAEQTSDDDEYAKLESLVFAGEEDPPPQQYAGPAPPPPLPPGKFGDVLDETNTMEEAMQVYSDAWTADESTGKIDLKKTGAVMNAVWIRQFAAMGMPAVHNTVRQILQAELGDAIGYVRQQRESAHRQQLYAGVLASLEKQNGYGNVGDLLQPLSDKKIKVRNAVVPDTRINRIIRENPWILDVEKHHDNPDKAYQKTTLARLQAVMRQWKKSEGSVPVKDAKSLVETGAEIERKKQTDQARQRINAGPGAQSSGAGGKSEDDTWFDSVRKANGGGTITVRDLLSK